MYTKFAVKGVNRKEYRPVQIQFLPSSVHRPSNLPRLISGPRMFPEVLWLHRRAPIPEVAELRGSPLGPARETEVREEAVRRLREIDELGLARDRGRYTAYMAALSRRSSWPPSRLSD